MLDSHEPGNNGKPINRDRNTALAEVSAILKKPLPELFRRSCQLSGFETDCAMIGASDWGFSYMKRVAVMLNVRLVGQFGSARNRGSTPEVGS